MPHADLIQPTRKEFLALAKKHTLVPVFRTLTADLETPVSAFLRAAWESPECFLLESVENGEKVGRYTFIGLNPYKRIVSRGRAITITEGKKTVHIEGDVFAILREALSGHTPARVPGLPPFTAGAVGFLSYDVVRQIEKLPSTAADELHVPDACLLFFDEVLAFDHVRKEIHLVVTADVTLQIPSRSLRQCRQAPRAPRKTPRPSAAQAPQTKGRQGQSSKSPTAPAKRTTSPPSSAPANTSAPETSFRPSSRSASTSSRRGRSLRRLPRPAHRQSLAVHVLPARHARRQRLRNPRRKQRSRSRLEIAGSSPEMLVRVHQGKVEYRPIAGTRKRSADEAADLALEAEMLADEKERAEHVMLVDLGRNDVGRVSEYGTVKVDRLMFVERYSHVMHLVSTIEGQLRTGLTAVDALRACFPAGTLSGAPKVRAMEIIEELEPARRGIYGGCVLYADFSGNLDSCITIRSMVAQNGQGHIQAGAGIVADSVPEAEYQECLNKAQAVLRAIERAREV